MVRESSCWEGVVAGHLRFCCVFLFSFRKYFTFCLILDSLCCPLKNKVDIMGYMAKMAAVLNFSKKIKMFGKKERKLKLSFARVVNMI